MAKHGIVEFARGANRIGVKPPATIAANYDITLPAALPSSTQAIQRDSAGVESYFTPVTSLSAVANPLLFSTNVPGGFNIDFYAQSGNVILAAPANGSSAKPIFRNLVVADFGATPPALDNWSAPATALNLNSQKITLLGEPTAATDAATKNYVDSTVQGFSVKSPVRAATTANIALSGLQTIDGVVLAAGDRVLVKNQTTASLNGIYVAAAGAWLRSIDADGGTEISSAMYLFVQEGSTNADSGWVLTTDGAITIGTTALNFFQFTGVGTLIGGAGLTKTGNQLDIGGTAGRIIANADSIDLVATGVAAGTYNSVTVDIYGRVTAATVVSETKVFRQAFTSATLSAGILTATHNIGNQFCQVQIFDNTNKRVEADDYTATSATVMTVDLTSYGAITGTWNVVIVG